MILKVNGIKLEKIKGRLLASGDLVLRSGGHGGRKAYFLSFEGKREALARILMNRDNRLGFVSLMETFFHECSHRGCCIFTPH